LMALIPRGSTWNPERKQLFHATAAFTAIWSLVLMGGMYTMVRLRSILQPLLWAFFMMMMLLPVCDFVEWCLIKVSMMPLQYIGSIGKVRPKDLKKDLNDLQRQYTTLGGDSTKSAEHPEFFMNESMSEEASESSCASSAADGVRARKPQAFPPDRLQTKALESVVGEGTSEEEEQVSYRVFFRGVAVVLTLCIFIGSWALFVHLIIASAQHMQADWDNYSKGAENLVDRFDDMRHDLPKEFSKKLAEKTLAHMQGLLKVLAGAFYSDMSEMMVEVLMTLLYIVFWLAEPIFIGETCTRLFKRYILLKVSASLMYSGCLYLWLAWMEVDLAVFFGMMAFFFNFVPEVGTLAATVIPLPIILFDARRKDPIIDALMIFFGELALKFLFGNIVEVKLIERQQDFRMHPVTILFFVAAFGAIWGPTGMLLSVPLMASLKAGVQAVPDMYRDPILIFFEGDKDAPKRYDDRASKPRAAQGILC